MTTDMTIELAKATPKQLRYLAKERDKDRMLSALQGMGSGALKGLEVLAGNETLAPIAGTVLIHTLWRTKIIDDTQAVALFGLVLGAGVIDILNPFN